MLSGAAEVFSLEASSDSSTTTISASATDIADTTPLINHNTSILLNEPSGNPHVESIRLEPDPSPSTEDLAITVNSTEIILREAIDRVCRRPDDTFPDPRKEGLFEGINIKALTEDDMYVLVDKICVALSHTDRRPWKSNGVNKTTGSGAITSFRGRCSRTGLGKPSAGGGASRSSRDNAPCGCNASFRLRWEDGSLCFPNDGATVVVNEVHIQYQDNHHPDCRPIVGDGKHSPSKRHDTITDAPYSVQGLIAKRESLSQMKQLLHDVRAMIKHDTHKLNELTEMVSRWKREDSGRSSTGGGMILRRVESSLVPVAVEQVILELSSEVVPPADDEVELLGVRGEEEGAYPMKKRMKRH